MIPDPDRAVKRDIQRPVAVAQPSRDVWTRACGQMRQKSLTGQDLALWRQNGATRTRIDPCNEIAVPNRAMDQRGSNGFQVTPSDTQGRSAADGRIRCGGQCNPFP